MKKLLILFILLGTWWVQTSYCDQLTPEEIRNIREQESDPDLPAPKPPTVPDNIIIIDGTLNDSIQFNKGVITTKIRGVNDEAVEVQSALTTPEGAPLIVDAPLNALGGLKSFGEDVVHKGEKNVPNGYAGLNSEGQIDVNMVPFVTVYFSGGHAVE